MAHDIACRNIGTAVVHLETLLPELNTKRQPLPKKFKIFSQGDKITTEKCQDHKGSVLELSFGNTISPQICVVWRAC
jgi:hypothetical protein